MDLIFFGHFKANLVNGRKNASFDPTFYV